MPCSTGLQAGRPTLEEPSCAIANRLAPCVFLYRRHRAGHVASLGRHRAQAAGAALLALLPLAAAAPATAETTLRAVMHSPLRLTDPHATTAYITAWHGYMIYDTLIAVDGDNALQPQMLENGTCPRTARPIR